MKLSVVKGATSVLTRVFIQDSSSTTGAGLTGLTSGSASLVCYRMRDDDGNAGATAISLSGGTKGTWSSGGFVEKDATNAPGWYEFGVPNAALASGSRSVGIHFKGATNMAPLALEIELTGWDNSDGVRGGMTAMPNVAAGASGGLPLGVDASGRVDVLKVNGTSQTARDLGASVLLSSGTGTGQLDFTSGVVKSNATQWLGGTIPAVNTTGVPLVDVKYLLGTVWSTPTVAGVPNVNAKTWNDLATVALPLTPTVAGRTLDVSAGGEAGLDWANVGSPTTSLALTGTTVATTQKVDVETIKTNPVVNAGTVTFPTTATLASTTNITAGTITTATNLTNAPSDSSGVTTLLSRVGGSLTISGGRVEANVTYFGGVAGTFSGGRPEANATHWGGTAVASAAVRANVVQWAGSGSIISTNSSALPIVAVGAAYDVLQPLESIVAIADAGHTSFDPTLLVNLDAAVSTRLASASYTAPPSAAATAAAVRDVSNASPAANSLGAAVNTGAASAATAATQSTAANTAAAAVKLKTDNLPASPAAVGSAMTLADGAITDAKVTIPAEAAGRPATFMGALRRAWEWSVNKVVRNRATGNSVLYGADNTTVLETHNQSTAGSTGSEVDTRTKGA